MKCLIHENTPQLFSSIRKEKKTPPVIFDWNKITNVLGLLVIKLISLVSWKIILLKLTKLKPFNCKWEKIITRKKQTDNKNHKKKIHLKHTHTVHTVYYSSNFQVHKIKSWRTANLLVR